MVPPGADSSTGATFAHSGSRWPGGTSSAAASRSRNLVHRVTPVSIAAINCWLSLAAASSACDKPLASRVAVVLLSHRQCPTGHAVADVEKDLSRDWLTTGNGLGVLDIRPAHPGTNGARQKHQPRCPPVCDRSNP